MSYAAKRFLSAWIEIVMYILCSRVDIGDEDRRALVQATKDLQDAL
jgi:hypothetical protein